MATFLAHLGMLLSKRDKRIARANLKVICGRQITPYREKVIIYHSFRNMIAVLISIFWISRHSRKRIAQITVMEPEVAELFKQTVPAINTSAHIGNWEMLAQAGVLRGIPVMTVTSNIGAPAMTRRLNKIRSCIGQEIVARKGAIKRMVHGLRNNYSLGMVIDQRTPIREGGVWLDFFDLPADVSTAPATLSRRMDVPIIITWARPLKNGCYKIEYVKKLTPNPTIDDKERTREIISVFEKIIRRHPSCWALNYRRWRLVCPGDDPSRYPFYARLPNKNTINHYKMKSVIYSSDKTQLSLSD